MKKWVAYDDPTYELIGIFDTKEELLNTLIGDYYYVENEATSVELNQRGHIGKMIIYKKETGKDPLNFFYGFEEVGE